MHYSDRLALALSRSRLTEADLAQAIGISRQAVNKVLLGSTKALRASHNSKAAAALGVHSDWLATGAGPMVSLQLSAEARLLAAGLDQIENEADRSQAHAICDLAIRQRLAACAKNARTHR